MSRKWIWITLSAVILLPALILIIGVLVLNTTDLNHHRDSIAERISQVIGRQLSLNGVLELNISSTSSVVITDIALANANWASEPEMLAIQRIEAEIELLPLLRGQINIPHFHLEGVKTLLETNKDGSANWVMLEPVDVEAEADVSAKTTDIKLPWIGNMFIGDVEISYHDGQTGKSIISKLDHARISSADKTSPTNIDIVGQVNKNPLEINGNLALPTRLASSGTDVPIELHANVLDFKADVNGVITGTAHSPVIDLNVQANAANLKQLRQVFGTAVPVIGKINFSTKLKGQPSKLQLSELKLKLGKARIDGWLTLDTSASVPDLKTDLTLSDFNLDKLLVAKDKPAVAKEKPASKAEDERLFPEDPLPFDALSQVNVEATLRANNLVRNNKSVKEAEIRISMVEGKLSASLLKHSFIRDEFTADLVLDASDKGAPITTITLKVPHIELSELLTTAGGAAAAEGPLAIDVSLRARGNSVAQIMATLDGNMNLLMEQGRADAKALDMFVGGLTAMVGTMFTDQSSKTKINCAICDFKFNDGILTPQLAVLDTQYSTVFAEGKVDLKSEQLDIKVSPVAKGVTLSVAFPVRLQGSLSKPGVQVEKTDALLKTGELWATVVYPPAALVKFADLGDGKQNPCVSMVAEKAGIPFVEEIGKAVGGAVKGVGGAVKDVGGTTVEGVGGAIKDTGSGIGKLLDKAKIDLDSTPSDETDSTVEEEDDFDMDQ